MKKSTSSRLRHRLELQSEAQAADGGGGYARSWEHVAYVWAEVIPLEGRERLFADKIQAEATHRIHIRYRDDITTSHRLLFENRIFSIRAIRNIQERDDELEILVEEGMED